MPLLTKKQDSAIIWEPRVKIATKSEKQHHFSSWPMCIAYAQLGGVLEQRGLLHKAVALFVFLYCVKNKNKRTPTVKARVQSVVVIKNDICIAC